MKLDKPIFIAYLMLIVLVGCSAGGSSIDYLPWGREPQSWIDHDVPGLGITPRLNFDNFCAGCTGEYFLLVHHGPSETDLFSSVTENNTDDFLPLSKLLYSNSLEYEDFREDIKGSIREIKSSEPGDKIRVTSYDSDTQTVYLDGLLPNTTRTLSIKYSHNEISRFSLFYRSAPVAQLWPGFALAPPEAKDWLIIYLPIVMLKPYETKEIPIRLEVPEGVKLPDKWEFWIVLKEIKGVGQVQVATEAQCRVLVTMR